MKKWYALGAVIIAFVVCRSMYLSPQTLDDSCAPKELSAEISSWWNPKEFWARQIRVLGLEKQDSSDIYQWQLIEQQKDLVLAKLDHQKERVEKAAADAQAQIHPVRIQSNPEIDKFVAQTTAQGELMDAQGNLKATEAFAKYFREHQDHADRCTMAIKAMPEK